MNLNKTTFPSITQQPGPSSALHPQAALLDAFFPGFSLVSSALYKYLKIDLSIYVPTILIIGFVAFASKYVNSYFWEILGKHFMSIADIRVDDEMYNMVMNWVSLQDFSQRSRRFVPTVNLNSRNWFLFYESLSSEEEDGELEFEENEESDPIPKMKKKIDKELKYTPSCGTHFFWYKGRVFMFKRSQNTRQNIVPSSEREEISLSSFGRNPTLLKELLNECRTKFAKNDENKTPIYRGGLKPGTSEPTWTRCMSRVSRPFSTVVLDELVKKALLEDMRDYLHPHTRRWYANRGIPYRRGYLLWGPPGTGKSSLSLAIAGYFKLKIYIVSLNSGAMNEENLGTLFSELPKACVVLLEDIDTAGLTHTRQAPHPAVEAPKVTVMPAGAVPGVPTGNLPAGKLSLSALLNILDGVASQEGRILIMTTNHIEKLDEALIRPGRVDMKVKFDLASTEMTKTLFRGIFTTLEGDVPKSKAPKKVTSDPRSCRNNVSKKEEADQKQLEEMEARRRKAEEEAKIFELSTKFATVIPPDTFSPAEIQGYLLKYKRGPDEAVANAAEWVQAKKQERLKEEEKKRKQTGEEEKVKNSFSGSETSAAPSVASSSASDRSATSSPVNGAEVEETK